MEVVSDAPKQAQFVPLNQETRTVVDTACAAYHLNRKPHTLRCWAVYSTWPKGLEPRRVNGRLAWPVAGIKKALGVPEAEPA